MRNTKAQVTLFVIIGIVILLAATIFFLLKANQQSDQLEDFRQSVTQVDETYRPIQEYMQRCMYSVSRQGLHQLGQHGGYINPLGMNAPQAFNYNSERLLDSDGVALSEKPQQSFVPYWFSSQAPVDSDNLQPRLTIPSLQNIQQQHERYVDERLLLCLDNFSDLESFGSAITVLDNPTTQIRYPEGEVLVKTTLPLTVVSDDGTTEQLESFLVSLPIPFSQYYYMATIIAKHEAQNQYLEAFTLSLLSYYGRPDMGSIPPIIWRETGFSQAVWEQHLVNRRIQNLLELYLPTLHVKGTRNVDSLASEAMTEQEKNFYDSLTLDFFLDEQRDPIGIPDISITHVYLDWPIYSDVSPSQGNLITSRTEEYSQGFRPLQLSSEPEHIYQSFYDVSFPVIVEIRQENLSSEEPSFTFLFALEANLKNNLRWKDYAQGKGPLPWDPSLVTLELVGEYYRQWQVQQDIQGSQGNLQEPFSSISLFTDNAQRLSGEFTVETYDKKTNDALLGVQVRVGAGSHDEVILGTTKESLLGVASFSGKGPLVQNGYLSLQKQGYLEHIERISLESNVTKHLGAKGLYAFEEKNVRVRVLEFVAEEVRNPWQLPALLGDVLTADMLGLGGSAEQTSYVYRTVERDIQEDEEVFITLHRLSTPQHPAKFSQVAILNSSAGNTTINLVPGRYALSGILIDTQGMIIPEDSKKICEGIDCLLMSQEERYIPDDPIPMRPVMWGGVEFNESQPWQATTDKVYENNSLLFTVIKFPTPTSIDSLALLAELPIYSAHYRTQVLPQFENE